MTVHRLKPDVVSREVDGEIVALDLDGGQYLGINQSGAELWPMLRSGATSEALAARLREVFGVSDDQAREDVREWLQWLREAQLLEA